MAEPVSPETTPVEPDDNLSMADHEAQYGRPGRPPEPVEPEPEVTPPATTTKPATPTEPAPRPRHRARSAIAGSEDVPRIRELTTRAKTAEDKLAQVQRELDEARKPVRPAVAAPVVAAPVAPVATAPATTTTTTPPPRALAPVPDHDPQPDPNKYTDYQQYIRDDARWNARQETRQLAFDAAEATRHSQAETSLKEKWTSWEGKTTVAKTKYADFEAVAFGPTNIPLGSPMDSFILEDDNGADVLYHLQSHPQERDGILQMPVLKQLKHLALLSQRFDPPSPSPTQAGATGSVAGQRVVVLPPRPPNPVRTEAQRVRNDDPPTDGRDLSMAEHERHFGQRPRR